MALSANRIEEKTAIQKLSSKHHFKNPPQSKQLLCDQETFQPWEALPADWNQFPMEYQQLLSNMASDYCLDGKSSAILIGKMSTKISMRMSAKEIVAIQYAFERFPHWNCHNQLLYCIRGIQYTNCNMAVIEGFKGGSKLEHLEKNDFKTFLGINSIMSWLKNCWDIQIVIFRLKIKSNRSSQIIRPNMKFLGIYPNILRLTWKFIISLLTIFIIFVMLWFKVNFLWEVWWQTLFLFAFGMSGLLKSTFSRNNG